VRNRVFPLLTVRPFVFNLTLPPAQPFCTMTPNLFRVPAFSSDPELMVLLAVIAPLASPFQAERKSRACVPPEILCFSSPKPWRESVQHFTSALIIEGRIPRPTSRRQPTSLTSRCMGRPNAFAFVRDNLNPRRLQLSPHHLSWPVLGQLRPSQLDLLDELQSSPPLVFLEFSGPVSDPGGFLPVS